uniref:Reverse transcriptase domain-containing protein n=1 Tax=Tanacetum cinerariifolium TaxID=118510 RepID=A0A6L2MCK7_TANCI|nr:hypothetical protein [Tanacetum cinerariifolium]
MSVLLAKERILKLIQAWDEKQIKSWKLPELLLQLSNDSRTIDEMLKQRVNQREQAANLAVQKKQEEQAAQSFTPYWNFSMIDDDEVLQAREKFIKAIQTFLQKFSRYPFGVMPKIQELMCKLLEDVQNINEELSEFINSPSWDRPMIVNDEEHSNQFSVENFVPILSEYEVTSDNESECDVPVNNESSLIFMTFSNPLFDCTDDFTSSDDELLSNEDVPMENFKIYSKPLFDDEEINSTKIDPHYFNAESNLIESLLNRDTLIDSFSKFDYLLELAHINPIPSKIEETDFDLEEEIRLVENLLHDNSSPRLPKVLNAEIADTIVESLSPFHIPVEDSDSQMEEIDLFLTTDDSMPSGIENDDYDSEGDIHFLE